MGSTKWHFIFKIHIDFQKKKLILQQKIYNKALVNSRRVILPGIGICFNCFFFCFYLFEIF